MKRLFLLVFKVCLAIGLVIAFVACVSYNPATINQKDIESGNSFFTDYLKDGSVPYDKSRTRESYAFIVLMPFDMNTRVAEIDGKSPLLRDLNWGDIMPLEPGTHTFNVKYEVPRRGNYAVDMDGHTVSPGYGTRNASREPATIEFTFEAGRYYYLGGGDVEVLTVGDWEINEISDSVYCRDNVWPAASVIQGMNIALDRALK